MEDHQGKLSWKRGRRNARIPLFHINWKMAALTRFKQHLTSCDKSILDGIKVFLFDCDGVIWKGSQTIPGAVETLNYLNQQGKLVYYIVHD